ncbi:unnamed protein product [Arctia plantaginis]|uniref:Uncharacterized protein n=1 Tax=Arctia plantaginis TaxID=874455 RepID=A0A8S0YT04_ARCPL|nr:unnamed protein product [Arctia plantaginis]
MRVFVFFYCVLCWGVSWRGPVGGPAGADERIVRAAPGGAAGRGACEPRRSTRGSSPELAGRAPLRHALAALPQAAGRLRARGDPRDSPSPVRIYWKGGSRRARRWPRAGPPAAAASPPRPGRPKVVTLALFVYTGGARGEARLLRHALAALPQAALASERRDDHKVAPHSHCSYILEELAARRACCATRWPRCRRPRSPPSAGTTTRSSRRGAPAAPRAGRAAAGRARLRAPGRPQGSSTLALFVYTGGARGEARLLRHALAALPQAALASERRDDHKEAPHSHCFVYTGGARGEARLLRHALAALPQAALASERRDDHKVAPTLALFVYTGGARGEARLLRHALAALPQAALASERRDDHKKEIARLGGGAMAAVWGGDPDGMTAELSLEMNKRLQAVLEDTLLKNITLKENMDTLGAEISRLKEQLKTQNETK